MIVYHALKEASALLSRHHEEATPWLDSLLLMEKATGWSRERLLGSFPEPLSIEASELFWADVTRRNAGFPVAYLLGSKEFYGIDFFIPEGILCPRPETETLVEASREVIERGRVKTLLDLGTGSGCVAISLALTYPSLRVSASDLSPSAAFAFRKNNERLTEGRLSFFEGFLFENTDNVFDVIASNPPYLTTEETNQRLTEGWREPSMALDGGPTGLDLIEKIITQAPAHLSPGKGTLLLEIAPVQEERVRDLFALSGFYDIKSHPDLTERVRVISGVRASHE